ncbi:uncharacterized protein LOC118437939 [Folsomia candida]|uniref:uncharacterized protein LOC118437939 n=1 Tax=Folsomia candida TaxID=158441 RepID=UPI0016054F90|nr:uncharacterized protein LOC118437939 [Folsomia candida]
MQKNCELRVSVNWMKVTIFLVILVSHVAESQVPEIHQSAALAQYTGIYTAYGTFIAIRELYFLVGLVTVLIAGNVLLTFFQLPSLFLPVHHNQRRSSHPHHVDIVDLIENFAQKWTTFPPETSRSLRAPNPNLTIITSDSRNSRRTRSSPCCDFIPPSTEPS